MSVYIENFETIFGVKSNIQALRNKVLDLAIKGKLVEQDPNDEPASELVKKIQAERNKLVKEGKIKKQQPLAPIKEDEVPHEIPESWEWVRLGDIGDSLIGLTYSPSNVVSDGLSVLRSNNIQNGKMNYNEFVYVNVRVKDELIVQKDDILICSRNGSKRLVGKSALIDEVSAGKMTFGAFMALFRSKINKYVYLMLNSNFFRSQLGDSNTMTVNQITQSMIRNILIPIPPHGEQHRIVGKVVSIMSEIDKLEESLQKKEHLIEMLPKAVVDAIGNCQNGEELKEQLQFVIENFETIFQTPDSMQELRNVVLQLAIEGKLSSQDPADETASELVKQIKVERDTLVKEDKIKKQQPLPKIGDDEIPFEIPQSWEWVRLGTVCKKIGAGSTPTGGKSVYKDNGVMFIRSQNVYNDGLRLSNVAFIDESMNIKMNGSQVESKDILLNITGASIGRSCIVPDEFGGANVNQHVTIIRLVNSTMKDFIHINMISVYIQKLIMDVQVGVSREGLSGTKLSNFIIPLPPVNEQYRIVQKVKSIMRLIDQMEDELKNKADLVEKMARP